MFSMKVIAAGVMVLGTLGAVGCSAPTVYEAKGHSTQKLLAPRAVVRTGASPKTRSALGVYEWRVYKGKSDFILTGYDKHRKAVRGFSLSFSGKRSGQAPAVNVRVLDGSGFAGSYDFQRSSLQSSLAADSQQFLIRAAADFTTVARYAPTTGGVSTQSAGIHILGEAAPAGCARNAGKFIAGGVGCVVGAATAETGAGAILAGSACYLAADSALDFLSSCYGGSGGAASTDPSTTFCDPGGSGFCTSSANEGSSSSSNGTNTGNETGSGAGDPAGNNQSEDPNEIINANNEGGQTNPSAEEGQDRVDTASNENDSCSSCQGGASNIEANESNGDVQYAENDSGGSYDDMGGSGGGGYDDMGGGDVETASFARLLGLAH